jgi:undecaprenyl-diphosphatase
MENADQQLLIWLNSWVGKSQLFDAAVEWFVSDYLVPVVLALILLTFWFSGSNINDRYRYQVGVLVALVSMALASWVVMINNGVYFRPRPFEEIKLTLLFYEPTDSSFPANTSAATFAISTTIWQVNRRLGIAVLVLSGLFGLSRVYAGVHYLSDIIAGGFIGVVTSLVVTKFMTVFGMIPKVFIKAVRIICLA